MKINSKLKICEINLDPIKRKLMHRESGEGWSQERADTVEREYRRFLYLMKEFPGEATAPSIEVDTFWHYHILDTMKYAADCEHVFGYFLHHYPYLGLRGEDDAEERRHAGERMHALYEQTFGPREARFERRLHAATTGDAMAQDSEAHLTNGATTAPLAYCNMTTGADLANGVASAPLAYCSATTGADLANGVASAPLAYCSATTGADLAKGAASAPLAYCSATTGQVHREWRTDGR